jgi:hypothetical protein
MQVHGIDLGRMIAQVLIVDDKPGMAPKTEGAQGFIEKPLVRVAIVLGPWCDRDIAVHDGCLRLPR